MKTFHELQAERLTEDTLKHTLSTRGYALIRNAVPANEIRTTLRDVADVLATAGWLREGVAPEDRLPAEGASFGDPDPIFKAVYQRVFNLESFHSLAHTPQLRTIMQMLVGDEILVHPKPIGRLIFPNCERLVVRAHQDYEFMKGDPEFFTVWIPLHDCAVDEGSLRILEGSHQHGVLQHQRDGLHVPELPLDSLTEPHWVSGVVRAGDVLIFHSLTVHAANPNLSDKMRISIDCRFQNARRELNPSNLVFGGESGKSWEKTYAGWRSNALQFYWKKLPLMLNPSRDELERLAAATDNTKMRERYTRMAAQLA